MSRLKLAHAVCHSYVAGHGVGHAQQIQLLLHTCELSSKEWPEWYIVISSPVEHSREAALQLGLFSAFQ